MPVDQFGTVPTPPRQRFPRWKRWFVRHPVALDHLNTAIRYRPFDASKDLETKQSGYLANIITTGTLFIPAASTFNDPWEAAPWLEYVLWNKDRHQQIADFLAFLSPQLNTPEKVARLNREVRQFDHEQVLREGRKLLLQNLRTTPIISLSDRADNFLMWSYYGAGHNGYALVFDSTVLPMAAAVRVAYSRRHPTIYLNQRDMSGISVQVLATKARQWRHEREWRVIVPQHNAEKIGFEEFRSVSDRGYYAQLPRNALMGVVLGDQLFNGPHLNKVLEVLRGTPSLRVWVAEIDRSRFRINVRPL